MLIDFNFNRNIIFGYFYAKRNVVLILTTINMSITTTMHHQCNKLYRLKFLHVIINYFMFYTKKVESKFTTVLSNINFFNHKKKCII